MDEKRSELKNKAGRLCGGFGGVIFTDRITDGFKKTACTVM
jgi:hypothetical protein